MPDSVHPAERERIKREIIEASRYASFMDAIGKTCSADEFADKLADRILAIVDVDAIRQKAQQDLVEQVIAAPPGEFVNLEAFKNAWATALRQQPAQDTFDCDGCIHANVTIDEVDFVLCEACNKRRRTDPSWRPLSDLEDVPAQEGEPRCGICERSVNEGAVLRQPLKYLVQCGFPESAVCFDCMCEWYDGGETDPARIKTKVLALRAPEHEKEGGEG